LRIKPTSYSFIFPFVLLLLGAGYSCKNTGNKEKKVIGNVIEDERRDLSEILKTNKLIVIAENSALSYFIYKGQKMGLEYEILNAFAKEIGVKLEVKVIDNLEDIISHLNNGEGDIIACNYTVTKNRRQQIDFTSPHLYTSQVLVQRKPSDWREKKHKDWKNELISMPEQLSRKTVHVWKGSSYYDRLVNLQEELGDTIFINDLEGNIIPEKAIEMVDKGFIDYTVIDKNIARVNQRHHPDIDTDLELSIKQRIAFGVRKSSPLLRKRFDAWLEEYMKTTTFKYIKHKYLNISEYANRSRSQFSSIQGSKISPYDEIIKSASQRHNWDWRLVAAIIYQESRFQLNLESFAGAYGLMQFMPYVGPSYGVYPDSPVDVQINGGVRKLVKDYAAWPNIPDSIQRLKFAMASYNAGKGHILDAQRLAEKYGKDPLIWDENVEIYVRELSDPQYYRDPVVRNGYMRGSETYNYIRDTYARYLEYRNAFPE